MTKDVGLADEMIRLVAEKYIEKVGDHPPSYQYSIILKASGIRIGGCSLRIGGVDTRHIKYGGNIGYDVDEPFRGNRHSLRACRLLLSLARAHGMNVVRITCDPENLASRRICERLGAACVEVLDLPEDDYNYVNHGTRRHCVYEMLI